MHRCVPALVFMGAASTTAGWHGPPKPVVLVVAGLLLIAAALVAWRAVWTGMIARGTAWAAISLGTLAVHLNAADRTVVSQHELTAIQATVLATCVGLALAGSASDADPTSRFRPARFAGLLQLALVLAVADAAMLGLLATLTYVARATGPSAFLALATIATVAGAVGLYRLASWGFLLLATVNATIAFVMIADSLELGTNPVRLLLLVPALAQLIIAAPVGVAIMRKAPMPTPAWLAATLRHAHVAGLVAMAALAVQPSFGPSVLQWCYCTLLAR